MGVDDPKTVEMIVTFMGGLLGVFFFLCFIGGVTGNAEPLDFSTDIGEVDDQDLFAVATGDEDYLAAHATLTPIRVEKPKKTKKPKKKAKKPTKPTKPKKPKKPKKKPVEVQSGPSNELLTDCIGALVGLGEKRGQARITATKLLTSNPRLTTVELFLTEAFKRENS